MVRLTTTINYNENLFIPASELTTDTTLTIHTENHQDGIDFEMIRLATTIIVIVLDKQNLWQVNFQECSIFFNLTLFGVGILKNMSHDMRFPTMRYVRPAKAHTSLRIPAV